MAVERKAWEIREPMTPKVQVPPDTVPLQPSPHRNVHVDRVPCSSDKADPTVVDRNGVALLPTQCSKGLLECRAARGCFDVIRGEPAHHGDAPYPTGSL